MANNNRTEENIELIRGDPKRAIRKLSVPTMMSMLILMIYNLADSLWVAGLGADALAAVGFITPVFFIIINVGNGIGAGANSLIARAIGAENKELADNAAVHTLLLSIILSIIVPIILIPFMGPLLNLMGAGSSTQLGIEYGQIMFGFTFFFVLSGVLQSLLRAEGDVKRAMNVTIVTSVLNIVLDPIFIYPTGWGVSGAAWATVLSVAVSCVIMGWWIWGKKDTYLTVTRKAAVGEINVEAETGVSSKDESGADQITFRNASGGHNSTDAFPSGATLTINVEATNAGSYTMTFLARRSRNQGEFDNKFATAFEMKINDAAVATEAAVDGTSWADYVIANVTLKAGANTLTIKALTEVNPINIDSLRFTPVA